eukprot:Pgem_evm1s11232
MLGKTYNNTDKHIKVNCLTMKDGDTKTVKKENSTEAMSGIVTGNYINDTESIKTTSNTTMASTGAETILTNKPTSASTADQNNKTQEVMKKNDLKENRDYLGNKESENEESNKSNNVVEIDIDNKDQNHDQKGKVEEHDRYEDLDELKNECEGRLEYLKILCIELKKEKTKIVTFLEKYAGMEGESELNKQIARRLS